MADGPALKRPPHILLVVLELLLSLLMLTGPKMDRKTCQSIKTFARHAFAAALCAIVVISGRVASAETDVIDIPLELANKLRPAITDEGAFDTPFFDGEKVEITLKALKGRGVILNFWATWCAPCVREMPNLDILAKKLEGTGVEVITVSADRKALKKVPPFFAANDIKNLGVYLTSKANWRGNWAYKACPPRFYWLLTAK